MVTVETIGRIRRAFFVDHKPVRQLEREQRVARKTVRKAIRGSSTEFRYDRQAQPQPRLGEFVVRLDGLLEANSKRPARERLTARRLFELLRAEGYQGAYDSVRLRLIGSLEQLRPDAWPVLTQVVLRVIDGHPIHAGTALVPSNAFPRSYEILSLAHLLH